MGKKAPGREFFDVRLGSKPSQTYQSFVPIRCGEPDSSTDFLLGRTDRVHKTFLLMNAHSSAAGRVGEDRAFFDPGKHVASPFVMRRSKDRGSDKGPVNSPR